MLRNIWYRHIRKYWYAVISQLPPSRYHTEFLSAKVRWLFVIVSLMDIDTDITICLPFTTFIYRIDDILLMSDNIDGCLRYVAYIHNICFAPMPTLHFTATLTLPLPHVLGHATHAAGQIPLRPRQHVNAAKNSRTNLPYASPPLPLAYHSRSRHYYSTARKQLACIFQSTAFMVAEQGIASQCFLPYSTAFLFTAFAFYLRAVYRVLLRFMQDIYCIFAVAWPCRLASCHIMPR